MLVAYITYSMQVFSDHSYSRRSEDSRRVTRSFRTTILGPYEYLL